MNATHRLAEGSFFGEFIFYIWVHILYLGRIKAQSLGRLTLGLLNRSTLKQSAN